MTFRLVCGDVMPGCAAHFEAESRDDVLRQVTAHAAADHDLAELDPQVAELVESSISVAT